MTHQKQHPGYTVSSITFYNPPHNSQQTTAAVNQQHLQQPAISFSSPRYISYAPLISSPSSSTVETSIAANLSHRVHPTMQAHPLPSTVSLQQLPPQFFHLYTTAPIQNPQLVIPSFTPISTDVKVAKAISSSPPTNAKIATTSPSTNAKIANDVSTSPSVIKNVKVVPSSSNTSSSATKKVVSSLPSTSSSTDVEDVKVISSLSITPSCANSTSPVDKRFQRLERNRLAARECRERRKAYILNLENKTNRLEDDNLILRQKIQELTAKLELMQYINQDNIRLEKLVKELKEKVMKHAKNGTNNCDNVVSEGVIIIDGHDCADVRRVKMEPEGR
jgi:hypothetical protein